MLRPQWLCLVVALPLGMRAQGIIQTVVGTDWTVNFDGRRGVDAPLGSLVGIAIDSRGNVFFSDPDNRMVLRLAANGTLGVIAGNGLLGPSGDGGSAGNAALINPHGVAVDADGSVYISDPVAYRIRRVSPDGIITTVAGSGVSGYSGDGGQAVEARLSRVYWLAVDQAGSLYFSDYDNHAVRKVAANGTISTIAGTGTPGFAGDGGPATSARLQFPYGLAVDTAGNVLVAELSNHRIRRIGTDGIIRTVAGDGVRGFRGDGGAAVNASIADPTALALDRNGNLFVSMSGFGRIRRITPAGVISTVAGSGAVGFSGDGGPATAAALQLPHGLAVDSVGNLYIADRENNRLRAVNPAGTISTVAGNNLFRSFGQNSPAAQAYLFAPQAIALDAAGGLLIADTSNHRIRRATPQGLISTVAGNGVRAAGPDGIPALAGTFRDPKGVTVDTRGNFYISDTNNSRIRLVSPDGILSTIVAIGGQAFAGDGGPATAAQLNLPDGIAFDRAGNLFIADTGNHRIRKVDNAGIITTVAGNGNRAFSGDGGPATTASLNLPAVIAFDPSGRLHFSDRGNQRIRRINTDGTITTVAGDGTVGGSGDGGQAVRARFRNPVGIAFDSDGSLYIADTGNYRVRKVDAGGIVTTIAGDGNRGFSGDGGPAVLASLNAPSHILAAPDGRIYITDSGNDRIRVISPSIVSFQVTPASLSFSATSGGSVTLDQPLTIGADTLGLPFEIALSVPWLRSDTTSATMPATVQIGADPSGLAPGTYQGAITIRAPNANPPSRVVNVTLTVEQAVAPRLAVEAGAGFGFSFAPGARPAARQLRLTNAGGGSVDFTAAASGGAWLSVSPTRGTVTPVSPQVLIVTAAPGDLPPGTYTGRIAISGPGVTIEVRVTMVISLRPATILLSQTGLTFTAVQGGGTVPPQTFGVLNIGAGVMDWTAAPSTLTGAGWLLVTPGSGSTDAASLNVPLAEVVVNHAGLAAGEYYGQVTIAAPGASNSPQVVSVVLNLLPPGSNPGPLVRPTGLIFTGVAGGQPSGSQTVTVSNVTATPRAYSSGGFAFQSRNFFSYVPANATVMPDQPVKLVVQPEAEGLSANIRRGVITLLFDDGATQTVNLLQVLVDGGQRSAKGRASGSPSADGCLPSRLFPVFTQLPNNFTLPAAWPNPVEVRVVDDCGAPLTTGSVHISFSSSDPPLALVSLKDGRWAGTWQARATQQAQVTVTVTAEMPGASVRGSVQVTGGLRANPNPPLVASGGVAPVAAPGGLVSIYGSRLAESQVASASLPLPTQLAGTTLTLAGRALPLLYVSDSQVNAILPYDVAVNTTHQIVVRKGPTYALPEPVVVAAAQPSIFTRDQTGRGQGLVYSAAGVLADGSAPVAAGDTIVIYAAGLGMTEPMVPAGQAAPSSPLSRVVGGVKLTIDGIASDVVFAGLVPGFTGLYQVNARVPPGASPGGGIPVVLTVADQESPPVTVALR